MKQQSKWTQVISKTNGFFSSNWALELYRQYWKALFDYSFGIIMVQYHVTIASLSADVLTGYSITWPLSDYSADVLSGYSITWQLSDYSADVLSGYSITWPLSDYSPNVLLWYSITWPLSDYSADVLSGYSITWLCGFTITR